MEVEIPIEKTEKVKPTPRKKPLSAYMIFTMDYRNKNPTKKVTMSELGKLW